MAEYFIAGPATVQMFSGGNLISTSKTLINNSITIETSAEDIRGGMGNQLFGKYFHDSTLNMELEDAMFRFEWLVYALGANISYGNDIIFTETKDIPSDGQVTLSKTAVPFGSATAKAWMFAPGETVFVTVDVTTGTSITAPEQFRGKKACIRYAYNNPAAKTLKVSSNIIPSEVTLVARAQLFAGSLQESSQRSRVGFVDIIIPRFLFNGAVNLNLTSAGVATTPISGSALAVLSEGCEDTDGYYAELVEILDNSNWYDDVVSLVVPGGAVELAAAATKTVDVNAYKAAGGYVRQPNSVYTFSTLDAATATVDATGKITGVAAGTTAIEFSITGVDTSPIGSCVVKVTA